MSKTEFTFPVGYHSFHKDQVFNFQMNRWYSFGYSRFEDMQEAGWKIHSFVDWKKEMVALAEKAVSEDRLINAAFYYRAAEFYTFREDPDKEILYDKFSQLFYQAIERDEIERFQIPFQSSSLPAIKLTAADGQKKGTIVIHGGFDSFIEELYSWMRYFADHGYDVIGFEGPGQGAARIKNVLGLDWYWERPAKAVLDFFNLDDVTWLGISMGGWFCLRAAAFEPRIKRVVASSIAFDYMQFPNPVVQLISRLFLKLPRDTMNRIAFQKMRRDRMHAWSVNQAMDITRMDTPMDSMDTVLALNEENLHSDLVKQDVLILTGREDHLIPFKMHNKQIKALTNARSVTGRVFTKEDHAQNHCQIGNTGLMLDVIVKWLAEKS
jgi:pimeloyl-ACP methyl ester carboxylesterase